MRDGSGDRGPEAGALRAAARRPPDPEAEPDPELPEFLDYRPSPPDRRAYRILRTDRGFRVSGEPPPEDELEAALREAGVRSGALVEIGDEELEWQP